MRVEWPKRAIRDFLVRERNRFIFEPQRNVKLPEVSAADLYIHIPFCKSLCPYCPYNRIRYQETLVEPYLKAVQIEIDSYRSLLGNIEIGSIYIGGGTPTTVLDRLEPVIERVRQRFTHNGVIAIETTPEDLDQQAFSRLRSLGVNLLSIGVQSFDDRYLKMLRRRYTARVLAPAITNALSAGFDSVNLDLMFALPGQTVGEVLADLDTALNFGAEQITLYPLFTFPYSGVGRQLSLDRVRFPDLRTRRRMYKSIHDAALSHDLNRVSVWGFKKDGTALFSSVTRDNYIGIGAGAGTHLPNVFYFNTFSVPAYTVNCSLGALPVSLQMHLTDAMESFYWLYWRLYETYIPKREFSLRFGNDSRAKSMLWLALKLRLLVEADVDYALTERGSFWIHLLQNYYVLNYIDTIWTRSMRSAWPARIKL
jgi:oxygen-independent coproporphyrinogen-3 oxidase